MRIARIRFAWTRFNALDESEGKKSELSFVDLLRVWLVSLPLVAPSLWLCPNRKSPGSDNLKFLKVIAGKKKRLTGQRGWGRWCSCLCMMLERVSSFASSPSSFRPWPSVVFAMLDPTWRPWNLLLQFCVALQTRAKLLTPHQKDFFLPSTRTRTKRNCKSLRVLQPKIFALIIEATINFKILRVVRGRKIIN